MKPEELTIEILEAKVGLPADQWHGKCAEIAHHAAELVDGGTSAYGHYRGPIDHSGYWKRQGAGFEQHGWVLLEDGRILDPTRFSFENKEPYIHLGDATDEYDEGGDIWRSRMLRPCPSPFGGRVQQLEFITEGEKKVLEAVTSTPFHMITVEQLAWSANLPYEKLGVFVHPVYTVLKKNDLGGFIPWDNWKRAVREGRVAEVADDGEVEAEL